MECKNPTFLTCFKSKTYKINHFYQSKYYNTIWLFANFGAHSAKA